MRLLYSNLRPCDYAHSTFSEEFERGILHSDKVKIATGYVSEESLLELKSILLFYFEENRIKRCELVIGMHGRDGFTRPQYDAAMELAAFLKRNDLGVVRVCTAFKYHGKTYIFSKEGKTSPTSGIVGSSNLSNILDSRQYEVDVLLNEESTLHDLEIFHNNLVSRATKDILDLPEPTVFINAPDLLEGRLDVEEAKGEYERREDTINRVFDIPLKSEPKSNLNAYFGKGRLTSSTGAIRPRHWYEVELIVPIQITTAEGYPARDSTVTVITDDGWKFDCKVQGDYGKNFRSAGDLRTLGRWVKGRLEKAGCLKVGMPVTDEVLSKYGRNTISLKETSETGLWLLDFSV